MPKTCATDSCAPFPLRSTAGKDVAIMPKLRAFAQQANRGHSISRWIWAPSILLVISPCKIAGLPLWLIVLIFFALRQGNNSQVERLKKMRRNQKFEHNSHSGLAGESGGLRIANRKRKRQNNLHLPGRLGPSGPRLLRYRSQYRSRLCIQSVGNGDWGFSTTQYRAQAYGKRPGWQWVNLPSYGQAEGPKADQDGFRFVEFNVA
jgi:hypothetical protein